MNKQKIIGVLQQIILTLSVLTLAWFIIVYIRKIIYIQQATTAQVSLVGDVNDLDEYAVYNAVLEHRFENGAYTDAELILLDEHTDFPLFSLTPDLFKFPNDTVSEPWWSDFSSKNHSHSTLGRMFKLSKPYLLVQSDYGFKHDLNIKLRDLNVNGTAFLQFSRVGFNSAKDEAVVHLGSYGLGYSEPPIGFEFGRYIFLKKTNQIWIIIREQDTFIS